LLVNAVDPRVGGVLIRGQKGTAKSTAVRALAGVLPTIDVVDGCRFSCDPYSPHDWCDECKVRSQAGVPPSTARRPWVIDLPVSATEDRLVGTIDLEHALKKGERRFEAGLLADANRGVLYVDEVNLLDDHLVDTLLDAAAMGINTVQREGIGVTHPSRFILVGTMNPEEGEVRPQLLDRFGLCVEIEGLAEPADRVEVIRRRAAFEEDPRSFCDAWDVEDRSLEQTVRRGQELRPSVVTSDELLHTIASLCAELAVDGHRADLTLARAAAALAALSGETETTATHVETMAPLVLAHRMRRKPFEQMSFDEEMVRRVLSTSSAPSRDTDGEPEPSDGETPSSADSVRVERSATSDADAAEGDAEESGVGLGSTFDRERLAQRGRRVDVRSADKRGRFTRTEPRREGEPTDVALGATIREAATKQTGRSRTDDVAISVTPGDVQNKVRRRKTGASIVFCVDASGSMGASARMQAAKSAILDLLVDAYQRRDRVGLVSFRGDSAEVVLAPTASVELAQLKLRALPTGGSTPLAHGIRASLEILDSEKRRDGDAIPWIVLVTDGRANVGMDGGLGSEDARAWAQRVRDADVNAVVLDTDTGESPITVARDLARIAKGEYVRLSEISGSALARAVRERLSSTPA
jgi:magnesium chelatase subunit D